MGKKIPFPVTKGTLGNKIDDREISQEPEMQELTRLYEGMTEEERRRTQDYLEQHGEIPDNKKQEDSMTKESEYVSPVVERGYETICAAKDCRHNDYPTCAVNGARKPIRIVVGGKCENYLEEE